MVEAVLVSGASGGIGSALCRKLQQAGYVPFIGHHSGEDRARALAAETGGQSVNLDLASDDSIDRAVDFLLAQECDWAGVVLAASPPPVIDPVFKIAPADFSLQWRVNVDGPRRLLDAMIGRAMRARRKGWIVGILSRAMDNDGITAKNMGSYVIAKYGQQGLLKVVEAEFPWLSVATVMPDFTETEMLKAFDPRFLDLVRATRPGRRFSSADEVAQEIMLTIGKIQ